MCGGEIVKGVTGVTLELSSQIKCPEAHLLSKSDYSKGRLSGHFTAVITGDLHLCHPRLAALMFSNHLTVSLHWCFKDCHVLSLASFSCHMLFVNVDFFKQHYSALLFERISCGQIKCF